MKITEKKKCYGKKVRRYKKKMKPNVKEDLQLAVKEKQHKINEAKERMYKELGKLETAIVREQKQQQKQN